MSSLTVLMARLVERQQSAVRLRADRALAALEYRGTAEAKKVLKAIAGGSPGHWLTQEAGAAHDRLTQGAVLRRTPAP